MVDELDRFKAKTAVALEKDLRTLAVFERKKMTLVYVSTLSM